MTTRSPSDCADWGFSELTEGVRARHAYDVDGAVCGHFLTAFRDESPLHVDDAYARRAGFPGRIVHGTVLNGFLSHFVGMVLPGRRALLLSVDMRYLRPVLAGDRIALSGEVVQRVDSQRVVVLRAVFSEERRNEIVARARVQVRVRDD